MSAGLQLVAHAALGLFQALHTLLHLKVSHMHHHDRIATRCLLPTYPSGGGSFVQVLLTLPPRYSIADLSTRFWYFVSDAATVPLSLLALSFGVTNTSLRTLLISSVLGAQV